MLKPHFILSFFFLLITSLLTAQCDDFDPCTFDFLDEFGNCQHTDLCDDGDPCTLDFCLDGICINEPFEPTGPCDDGYPGTINDVYTDCICMGTCDDDNAQTYDVFVEDVGCAFIPFPIGTSPCETYDCEDPILESISTYCSVTYELANGECLILLLNGSGDDENACTINDSCDCGKLTTEPIDCNDNDPCTIDTCLPTVGCVHLELVPGMPCDDFNPATTLDQYDEFCNCVGVPVVEGCTNAEACNFSPTANTDDMSCFFVGSDCDDGNPCTILDEIDVNCNCTGVLLECSDLNACTIDSCDPATGECIHTPIDCDDGNSCTIDSCDPNTGECSHTPVWLEAIANLDHPACYELCGYRVYSALGTEVDNTVDDNACLADLIVQVQGQYSSDGDPVPDCVYTLQLHYVDLVCDDGDPCTSDSCNLETGNCVFTPISEGDPCDDGNPETFNDQYVGPNCDCVGTPEVYGCPQTNACNYNPLATSDDGSCVFPGEACDDGDPCTENDMLDASCNCVGTPKNCDDGNPFTTDYCDQQTGDCVHIDVWDVFLQDNPEYPCYFLCSWVVYDLNTAVEYDSFTFDPCNGDLTVPVYLDVYDPLLDITHHLVLEISYDAIDCDDENICTIDTCNPLTGECIHTEVIGGEACDDNDPCTINDTYNEFCDCVGEPVSCNDLDPCTTDYCDGEGNCIYEPIDCDDGDYTTIDACENGICTHTPFYDVDLEGAAIPCYEICGFELYDVLNEQVILEGGTCTSFDLTVVKTYTLYNPGTDEIEVYELRLKYIAIDCPDDGDPCTNGICDSEGNCIHVPINCDDGSPYTIDECVNGECTHTGVWVELLTDPTLNPCFDLVGYIIFVDDNPIFTAGYPDIDCDNEQFINSSVTIDGVEYPYQIYACYVTKNCDDGDPCTDDFCDEETGLCVHQPKNCDDGDELTIDTCIEGECVHIPIWNELLTPPESPCFDPCGYYIVDNTTGEEVFSALPSHCCCDFEEVLAISGAPGNYSIHYCYEGTVCDDGDDCTIDACDLATGDCIYTPILPGMPCDDGNAQTTNDMYDDNCNCIGSSPCAEDLSGDGQVNTVDLLLMLGAFGSQCD